MNVLARTAAHEVTYLAGDTHASNDPQSFLSMASGGAALGNVIKSCINVAITTFTRSKTR